MFADADPSERTEGESSEEAAQQWEKLRLDQRRWEEDATDDFGRVVLSNRMLLDHLCTDYERVCQSQAKALDRGPIARVDG